MRPRLMCVWVQHGLIADYIQQFMEETFETPFYLRRNPLK